MTIEQLRKALIDNELVFLANDFDLYGYIVDMSITYPGDSRFPLCKVTMLINRNGGKINGLSPEHFCQLNKIDKLLYF